MNKTSPRTKSEAVGHKLISEPVGFMLTLLFASLTVYVSSLAHTSITNSNGYNMGTITVSGHGEVKVKPNLQKLSIDIDPSSATSTESVNYSKKIVAYLKSKGVSEYDIRAVDTRTLMVNLRGSNIAAAKSIASDVEKIASKYITPKLEDPEFENTAILKARALEMALNNAKMSAMKVGQSLGADIGKVVSFYDNNNNQFAGEYSDPNMVISDISVSYQIK